MTLQAADLELNALVSRLEDAIRSIADIPSTQPDALAQKKAKEPAAREQLKVLKPKVYEFRAEIRRSTNQMEKKVYDNKYKEYDQKIKALEKQLRDETNPKRVSDAVADSKKKTWSEKREAELMGEGGEDGAGFTSSTQVLNAGVRINQDAIESLQRTERMAATAEQVGQETIVALQKQRETLLKIDEGLDNLQGQLDRAKRDVQWFYRRMSGDKCFVMMFCGVVLFLCVLVFWSIYKKRREAAKAAAAPAPTASTGPVVSHLDFKALSFDSLLFQNDDAGGVLPNKQHPLGGKEMLHSGTPVVLKNNNQPEQNEKGSRSLFPNSTPLRPPELKTVSERT